MLDRIKNSILASALAKARLFGAIPEDARSAAIDLMTRYRDEIESGDFQERIPSLSRLAAEMLRRKDGLGPSTRALGAALSALLEVYEEAIEGRL